MYKYMICNQPDKDIFKKQCLALEKNIPEIHLVEELHDVDDTQMWIYNINNKRVTVCNDYYIGGVFVESEIDLEQYFK